MFTANEIEELFYDKLDAVIGVVPLRATPVGKIDTVPIVILQWIGRRREDWCGTGGTVEQEAFDYAIRIVGEDRKAVDAIFKNIADNLLDRGQIVVDRVATPMQLVYIRPITGVYIFDRDDVVSFFCTGFFSFNF